MYIKNNHCSMLWGVMLCGNISRGGCSTCAGHQRALSPWLILTFVQRDIFFKAHEAITNWICTHRSAYLAKPTPRLVPLASRRTRVEMAWLKGFSMASSSCSSMDIGRLEMYKLVGSCSCCWKVRSHQRINERGCGEEKALRCFQ